jgi:hypothetical protein
MASFSVPCPSCGKSLKLKDESYLGKKVRCPACQMSIMLPATRPDDDDEIQIELVDPVTPVPPTRAPRSAPEVAVGTSARRIPDAPAPASMPFGEVNEAESAPESAADMLRRMIEEKKRRSRTNAMMGVALLGVAGIVGAILVPLLNKKPAPGPGAPVAQQGAGGATTSVPVPVAVGVVTLDEIEKKPQLLAEFQPTTGKPIDLRLVPDGVNLLIHLRPARLWTNDQTMAELRAALTEPVVQWIEAEIKETCRRPPEQIEEAIFAIVLGPTGSEPQVSTVVRLVTPGKPSDFLDEFKGKVVVDDGTNRLVTTDKSYYAVSGAQTFAIGPVNATSEVQAALERSNDTIPDGVLELVRQSDRERLVTVIFEIDDIRRHIDSLFAENVRPAVREVVEWFGEDVNTVCWSGHLDQYFHSEFSFFPKGTRSTSGRLATAKVVNDEFKDRLPGMPLMVRGAVQKMNPGRVGFRNMIGRFPAMMQAYAMQTAFTLSGKTARMTTVLPAKAAPNLALGTLLTWDESTRTNFSASAMMQVAESGEKIPDKVEERLRMPIDAEVKLGFEEAFRYILGEARVNVEVDGPGIKLLGVTKNEKQDFNLGKAPAFKALQAIILRPDKQPTYKDIVFLLDEPNKKIVITSKDGAAALNLPQFDIRGMK